MANVTLTSPDLAVGEQLQVQIVNGDGVIFLTIIGATGGGGGGTVTDVTGTDPIVVTNSTTTPNVAILPATDADAGSMSAADKAKLDAIASGNLWPFDTPIPAAAVNPELAQAQAVAGGGQSITVRSQAAAVASGDEAGAIFLTCGKSLDGLVSGTVLFGSETVVGGSAPPTGNYFGALDLTWHETSAVVIANFGRGTNGIGAGVNAVEISAFSELNLATEGANSIINIQPASSFGGQSFFSFQQDPATGLPIFLLTKSPGDPVPTEGIIRFAFDNSGSNEGLLVQRDSSNTVDLEILSRHFNELYFGSFSESNRYHASQTVLFEILNAGGSGWVYTGPAGGVMSIGIDANKTVALSSSASPTKDAAYQQLYAAVTASATATQVLDVGVGGILLRPGPAPAGIVTKLVCNVVGVDQTTGEFSAFRIATTVRNVAGVLTGSVVTTGTVSDADHSAGGAAVAPIFQIIANALDIYVTPWSANSIHWSIAIDNAVANAGTF